MPAGGVAYRRLADGIRVGSGIVPWRVFGGRVQRLRSEALGAHQMALYPRQPLPRVRYVVSHGIDLTVEGIDLGFQGSDSGLQRGNAGVPQT